MSLAKVPVQQQHHSQQGHQQQQITPFQVLKVKVYPVINSVILKLIDHIVKSQQVQKHEQHLKKKKLLDQLQRKYIQRQVQKQQLGSDYQQSDDEVYYKKLQMKREDVQGIISQRLERNKLKKSPQQHDDQFAELGQNVFNPIQYIVNQLKMYQKLKAEGRLDQFQPKKQRKHNNTMNQNTQEPQKMQTKQQIYTA